MILYHGSNVDIESIDLSRSSVGKDYLLTKRTRILGPGLFFVLSRYFWRGTLPMNRSLWKPPSISSILYGPGSSVKTAAAGSTAGTLS